MYKKVILSAYFAFLAAVCCRSAERAIPTDDQIVRAEAVMQELFESYIDMSKRGDLGDVQFAGILLGHHRETKDMSLKFVLLRESFRRLVEGGNLLKARELLGNIRQKAGSRYSLAIVSGAKNELQKLSAGNDESPEAVELISFVNGIQGLFEEINALKDGLARKPSNQALQKQLAVAYINAGDWKPALKIFAERGGAMGKVAAWELAYPDGSDDFTPETVADYWWDVAARNEKKPLAFESTTAHAAEWYQIALDKGIGDDLKRRLVLYRIKKSDEVSGDIVQVSAPTVSSYSKRVEPLVDETVVVLKTGSDGGETWQYAFTEPRVEVAKWTVNGYHGWIGKQGKTAIQCGNARKGYAIDVKTSLAKNHGELWLRKEFVPEAEPRNIKSATLAIAWQSGFEVTVWLNGVEVFREKRKRSFDVTGDDVYSFVDLPTDEFRRGRNVLGVHVVYADVNSLYMYSDASLFFDAGLKMVIGDTNGGPSAVSVTKNVEPERERSVTTIGITNTTTDASVVREEKDTAVTATDNDPRGEELKHLNDLLKLKSFCGLKFGVVKMGISDNEGREEQLERPFRNLDKGISYGTDKSSRVATIEIKGSAENVSVSEVRQETDAMREILEKKYGVQLKSKTPMAMTPRPSWIKRYAAETPDLALVMNVYILNGTAHFSIRMTNREVTRQIESVKDKAGLKRNLTVDDGANVL